MDSPDPKPAEHFKLRHVHAITGTFVIVAIGILLAVILLAGRSQRWFIGNVSLGIALPEAGAAGIRRGSEVYFLGTLMGTVSDVSVDPAGRMEAQVNIRRDFFLFIREDSSAVVKRKFGMVGDAYFEITRGNGKTLPEKNARIVCSEQLPSALEAAVEEVRSEAVPALRDLKEGLRTWTTLGSNLVTASEGLSQLVMRGNEIASEIQQGKGSVGKMLTDPAAAEELQVLLTKASSAMEEFRGVLANLREASGNLQLASTNLPVISDVIARETHDLPGLVLQTQKSMRELERFIDALQRHWLFRRYMDKPAPPTDRTRRRK